jgi:hypothetical protein
MGFFAEVKAKLGLDIAPFERGMDNAKRKTESITGGIAKKIGGMNQLGGALAVALGINLQSIAEKAARLWIGFSKDAEAALDATVAASEKAADEAEARLKVAREAAKQRAKDAEDETKRIETAKTNLAQTEKEIALAQLDDAGKIAWFEQDIYDAMRDKVNAQKESAEWYDAEARRLEAYEKIRQINEAREQAVEKELLDFFSELDDYATRDAKAQEEKVKTLKEQKTQLERQRDVIKQTLAEQDSAKKKDLLPSSDDVRSGKRNIGSIARRNLSDLDKAKQDEQRAADRAQRAFDRRNNAGSSGERDAQENERQAAVRDLQNARARRSKLEGGLEGRVSDIETNKASLKELESINKGMAELNAKLALVSAETT